MKLSEDVKPLDHNLYVVQLTSLRGVACMVVLIGHVIQVVNYRAGSSSRLLDGLQTLIAGAFNAEGAVLVFFVLSGCVLSLSLRNSKTFSGRVIFAFYLKRVFRLYPLLWLSLLPAALSMVIAVGLARQGVFTEWLRENLFSGLTLKHSLLSITGLYTRYNGPMWSLRVEIICSLLFPALFLLVRNRRSRGITLLALGILLLLPVNHRYGTCFVLSFAIGALIPMLPYKPSRLDIPLLWLAIVALVYDRLALGPWNPPERYFDLIETTASFWIVRDIYTAGQRYRFFLSPPVVTLGEISFSVYLLHLPIFLILFTLGCHMIGKNMLLDHAIATQIGMSAVTALVTIIISIVTYRLVELPMHNVGRRLAKRFSVKARSDAPTMAGLQKAEPPLA